jgi:hypothetical protein
MNGNSTTIKESSVNNCIVRTVFLGLDHPEWTCANSVLYEINVFDEKNSSLFCMKYKTWNDAMVAHDNAVQNLEKDVNHVHKRNLPTRSTL